MELALTLLLFVALVATAIAITVVRRLFAVVMLSGVFSLLSALLFIVMDAVDVAFTEAAVGGGISSVLMLGTIALTARTPDNGSIRVTLGEWSTPLAVHTHWATHRFTIPSDASEPGLQMLTITWPELPQGPDRWRAALTELAHDRTPELHPVFGEVFSLIAT